MKLVQAEDARCFARAVLTAAGLEADDAAAAAELLVEANLRGIESHGLLRLLQYSEALASGQINPRPDVREVRRAGATALVDADGGYGFRPTLLAVDVALDLAAELGVGVVGVRASHHFGAAGAYAMRIARAGCIGLVTTNSSPVLASPSGGRPVVGNNPIAIGVPSGNSRPPILADVALSEVAYGKIRHAAAEGVPIPLGWARDEQGNPTTNAAAALAAHSLEPVGGHKGFALALVIELLTGALTGSPVGLESNPHEHVRGGVGHLVIAIAPGMFGGAEAFLASAAALAEMVRLAVGATSIDEVTLPGDPEHRLEAERRPAGIPLSRELSSQLAALAATLGVRVPAWAEL
jgi:L-2-hydroxycarboxylate dehydrogenase (NAD+)